MKILTFDIEEWYIEKMYRGDQDWKYYAYDDRLDQLLRTLDNFEQHATFFCLGELVNHFPHVVRKIARHGHEIGCHSLAHKWVNKQTPEEFRADTARALDLLRQATGQPVESFRAPAFSIGEDNKWAFEILAELGVRNDASIFPGSRDFGGFPSFPDGGSPCRVVHNGVSINEFPIALGDIPIIHKKIAYSGGGYFRMLPISYVKEMIDKSDYTMCYFHIADIVDIKSKLMTRKEFERYFQTPGTLKNRLMRYIKSNIGRSRASLGLLELVIDYEFRCVAEAAAKSSEFPEITI